MESLGQDRPITVLVVDDNAANRELAQQTLLDEGYAVVLATNGLEAIAAFSAPSSVPPDCVLLDVRMPTMDGFEACLRIREAPGGKDVPVIFLTALRDVDTFDRALEVGGDDFLTKPVRPPELLVRVKSALEIRRMRLELGEQYELMRGQRDHLMRAQLMKERLMAFVVHDLKNPVNAMDLHAQLLLRNKGLADDVRATVAQMRSEAKNLTRMISNLLDIAKADEGKLDVKLVGVEIARMVDDVLLELTPMASAHAVTLDSAIEVKSVTADRDLLWRLLANLIENAVRHTPRDGRVTVSVVEVAGEVEVAVRDTGPGVPPSMRERIFDPFVQLDAQGVHASRGGRGLGLAFCKLAATAHGGALVVDDASPGAVFRLRLPRVLPS